jgi:hypothetical protein
MLTNNKGPSHEGPFSIGKSKVVKFVTWQLCDKDIWPQGLSIHQSGQTNQPANEPTGKRTNRQTGQRVNRVTVLLYVKHRSLIRRCNMHKVSGQPAVFYFRLKFREILDALGQLFFVYQKLDGSVFCINSDFVA